MPAANTGGSYVVTVCCCESRVECIVWRSEVCFEGVRENPGGPILIRPHRWERVTLE